MDTSSWSESSSTTHNSMNDKKLVQRLIRRTNDLFTCIERVNVEWVWLELAEFILNNQYLGTYSSASTPSLAESVTPGSKRMLRVFDSTAIQDAQELAAAFHGTVTNPATIWSQLRFKEEELNNNQDAIGYLNQSNHKMHTLFDESNFNTEIGKAYQSFVALGNMVLLQETREDDNGNFAGFIFTSCHVSTVAWQENKEGKVDTLFRKFTLTAEQAMDKWPDSCPEDICKMCENFPDRKFDFIHCIYPRRPNEVKLDKNTGLAVPLHRPFASVYICMSFNCIVEHDGFYEFPAFVARWSLMPGEVTGRGPGHIALPDVREINRVKQRIDEASSPSPIVANRQDICGQLDLRPNQLSIMNDINGIKRLPPDSNIVNMDKLCQDLKQSIKRIFYLDKLLLPPREDTGEMTAYEVAQRIEQMQRVLGPVMSRIDHDFLQPLVIRSYKIMERNGVLPPMPDILKTNRMDVDINFINQLAKAQQIQDVSTIQQWVQGLMQLAQAKPEVLDNINSDGVAKHTARVLAVPEDAIANDKDIKQVRQQRQQQQAQTQHLQNVNLAADSANKLGVSAQQAQGQKVGQ